jgi:hypothetical protein
MATAPGFQPSTISEAIYSITQTPGTTAAPQPSPVGGTYRNPVEVGLTSTTNPSTICYTIDGSDPTCNNGVCTGTSATYSSGTRLRFDAPTGGGSVTLKALACSAGNTNSEVVSHVYQFQAAAIEASPAPGTVAYNTSVLLSTATVIEGPINPVICYRTDGGAPACNPNGTACLTGSAQINGSGGTVDITQNTTIRAIACRANYQPSEERSFAYTVQLLTPGWATANDQPGTYNNDLTVDAVPTTFPPAGHPAGIVLCYGTNATAPSCNAAGNGCAAGSTTPPSVTVDNTTVRVVACHPNYLPSQELSGVFRLQVAPIAIQSSGPILVTNPTEQGIYWNNGADATFTLSTATNLSTGVVSKIRWSKNGTTPTCDGDDGSQPTGVNTISGNSGSTGLITAAEFATIKAIGCKENYQPSVPRQMTFGDPTQVITIDPLSPPGDPMATYNQTFTVSGKAHPNIADDGAATDPVICYTFTTNNTEPPDPVCNPTLPAGPGQCTTGSSATPPTVTTDGTRVKARACKSGVPNPSSVVSAHYRLKVGTPTFSPNGGQVFYGDNISLNTSTCVGDGCPFNTAPPNTPPTPDNVTFRFTTGSPTAPDPTCVTGTLVTGPSWSFPFNAANGAPSAQIKVIACRGGFQASDIASATFTAVLKPPTLTLRLVNDLSAPTAPEAPYTNAVRVDFQPGPGPTGVHTCYRADNGIPACGAGGMGCATGSINQTGNGVVTGADPLFDVDNTFLRAITCAPGYAASAEATMDIQLRADVPDVTGPAPGPQTGPITLQLANGDTPNTTVCYSTDGTDIPLNCTAVAGVTCVGNNNVAANASVATIGPIGTNLTLKARACRSSPSVGSFEPSAQLGGATGLQYTFTPYTHTINVNGNDSDWINAQHQLFSVPTARARISWDNTYVYLWFDGLDLATTDTNRYFHFYVRAATGPTTLTPDDLPGGGDEFGTANVVAPMGSGYTHHYWVRTNGTASGVRTWNGAQWLDATGMTFDYQLGANQIELRFSRTELGLTGPASTLLWAGRIHDNNGAILVRALPAGTVLNNTYYLGDMNSANFPNFAGYIVP